MAMNCDEINQVASELKMKFEAGMTLSANDLDLLVELTLAARDCSGEVVSIDSAHYKAPLETITDLTNLNYLLLTDQERHYVKETNIEYVWQAEATQGQYEPFDKGVNTQGFWLKMDYAVFTDTQEDRLRDSVYEDLTQTLSVSPTSFEKGVSTNLVYTWNVNKRDDTLNTTTLNGEDKLAEATGVNRTYNINSQVGTKTISLVSNVTKNNTTGGTIVITNNVTSSERIPQYFGKVVDGNIPLLTYAELQNYTKFLSTSSAKSVTQGYTNEKMFFLSINTNAVILDGNGFNVTPAFTKSTVTIKLADGTDQTITQYLLNNPLNSTGTYIIN
jgi:hypothetical protein